MKLKVKSTSILLYLLALLMSNTEILAQTVLVEDIQITIRGEVVSKIDNMPIGFANIGVENTLRGTAADENGKFTLRFPEEFASRSIVVSAIGYESISLSIDNLRGSKDVVNIELTPTQYRIEQVNINAESLILYGLLKKAVTNIPNVYLSTPLKYTFTYKNQLIVGALNKRSEGYGFIYDSVGYHRQNFADCFSSRSYKFMGVNRNYKNRPYAAGLTNLDDLLSYDVIRSAGNVLDVSHLSSYRLELIDIKNHLGDTVYIIGFKNLNPDLVTTGDFYPVNYHGEVYLNTSDMSVIKTIIRGERSQESIHGRSFATSGSKDQFGEQVMYEVISNYHKKNKRYTLSSINYSLNFIKGGKNKGKSVTHFAISDVKPLNEPMAEWRDYFENTSQRRRR